MWFGRRSAQQVPDLIESDGGAEVAPIHIPDDHLVRAIAAVLDLSWVHGELAPYYSRLGAVD